MLFCGLVAWKCHVCFFLCKDVTKKKTKKEKSAHVSYIYLYTHTFIHTRTCAHTLSCRPHSLLCYCAWEPLSVKASTATATARQRAQTHTHTLKTHTHESRTDIFSHCTAVLLIKALPQIFALLFYLSLLVSRTHTQTSGFSVDCFDCFPALRPAPQLPQKMINK